MSACSGGATNGESQKTAPVTFGVNWIVPASAQKPVMGTAGHRRAVDCSALGVSTISAVVSDATGSTIATGGPWNCSEHAGTVNVPVGSGRSIAVAGKDSSGSLKYSGTMQNLTISQGTTNDLGEVTVVSFTPTGLTTTVADGQITVTWNASAGAASYNLYYRSSSGVTTSNGTKTSGITGTSKTVTGLTNGTTYYFIVTAVNSAGEGTASSETSGTPQVASAVPTAPTGLFAAPGSGNATVTWNPVTGATSYNLYYGTSTGVTTANGTKVAGATSGSAVTGLTNGTTYYFIVTAVNSAGESIASSEISATPFASITVSSSPTGVSTASASGQVTVSWTATTGAATFNVYYRASSGVTTANGVKVSGITGTSTTITGLTNGTTYYFIVTAVNSAGESIASSEISAIPSASITVTFSPTGVSAANGSRSKTVVAGGVYHSLALKPDGTVWAWGDNEFGQLGDGTTTNRSAPVQVSGLSGVTAIAGGGYHSLALKPDGTVWAWGDNAFGQLGDGTTTDRYTPVQVSTLSGVISIASGDSQTIALKSDGTVWAWGHNNYGQLGDGTTTDKYTPVQVSGLSGVTAIAGADHHTIALKSGGTVWAWGSNYFGQLGDGTTTDRYTPVQVSILSGVTAIDGGYDHSIALKSDGTVWAWGLNSNGQLGDGTTTDRHTPVQVSGLGDVTTISGGLSHTVAMKFDGTVWAWGDNAFGQLGDGTTTDRYTPVQVSTLSGMTGVPGLPHIVISWNAVTGAKSYTVYWGTSSGVTAANALGSMSVTGTVFTHTGVTTGTTYYYVVVANNEGGPSTPSSEVFATPYTLVQLGGAIQGKTLNLATTVTTLAGGAASLGSSDGTGTAARFNEPYGVTTDGTNLYVADTTNHTIRQVVIATGAVTTLAGSAGVSGSSDGTGTAARFISPYGITTDGANLYVTDIDNHTIRKVVISSGIVTTLAGAGTWGTTDGTGTAARFNNPIGITTDGTNLYVTERSSHTIRKVVVATGVVTTIAGSAELTGSTDGTGTAARFNQPSGITTDGTNLYVADYFNHTIRKVVIASGVVTTLAGSAGTSGTTDGMGSVARFYYPLGITTDGTNLYVSDTSNHTIRKVVIATGVVTTLAGSAGTSGTTDGTGTAARFRNPVGITTDGTNLYVSDTWNHTFRKIQ